MLRFTVSFKRYLFYFVICFFYFIFNSVSLFAVPLDKSLSEKEILTRIMFDRKNEKNKRLRSPVTEISKVLMRPRGASLDGRYVLFEKRKLKNDSSEFFLVLFDLQNRLRKTFTLDSFTQRNSLLKKINLQYNLLEGIIAPVKLVKTGEIYTDADRFYKVFFKKEKDGFFHLKIISEFKNKKRLVVNRIFINSEISKPKIQTFYFFYHQKGIAFKITYKKYYVDNNFSYYEEIICINEDNITQEFVIKRENSYQLLPFQKKFVYLTDILYNTSGKEIEKKLFFLDGRQRKKFQ